MRLAWHQLVFRQQLTTTPHNQFRRQSKMSRRTLLFRLVPVLLLASLQVLAQKSNISEACSWVESRAGARKEGGADALQTSEQPPRLRVLVAGD